MSNVNVLSLVAICGVLVGVLGLTIGVFPLLKKKKVNVDGILNYADKALLTAEPVICVAKEILPNNPVVNIVDFIEKRAEKTVKGVQQLNDSSQLADDARKQTAQNSVYAALQEIGIAPTDNQKKLIDDSIEAAVYDLPHAPLDVKQLQDTNTQLQSQIIQLQQQNTQLQQTIVQPVA